MPKGVKYYACIRCGLVYPDGEIDQIKVNAPILLANEPIESKAHECSDGRGYGSARLIYILDKSQLP